MNSIVNRVISSAGWDVHISWWGSLWTHFRLKCEINAGWRCCSTKNHTGLSVQVYTVYIHLKYSRNKAKLHSRHKNNRPNTITHLGSNGQTDSMCAKRMHATDGQVIAGQSSVGVCGCVCLDVNQGSTDCNRCSQRLVILHAQTY